MKRIKNKTARNIMNFIMLTIGTIIAAFALELFLIPNTILDGGITGISIIAYKTCKTPIVTRFLHLIKRQYYSWLKLLIMIF